MNKRQLFITRGKLCDGVVYYEDYTKNRTYNHVMIRFGEKKKSPNTLLKEGEIINFTSLNSPLKFNFHVTCSFSDGCEAKNQLSINMFMKRLIGDKKAYSNFNTTHIINNNCPWFAGSTAINVDFGFDMGYFQRP